MTATTISAADFFSPAANRARREATRNTADQVETGKERVRRDRRPLPSHAIDATDTRRWALAVCTAEVKHSEADFTALALKHGLMPFLDRYSFGAEHEAFQFDHERKAAVVLNWMSHLRTQESFIVGKWSRWHLTDEQGRRELLATWRKLARGVVKAIAAYRTARAAIDLKAVA